MKGWSVGNFGLELSPFGLQSELQRAEVAYFRTELGIGSTCSAIAINWLIGDFPPLSCLDYWSSFWCSLASKKEDSLEFQALQTPWLLWHAKGNNMSDERILTGQLAAPHKVNVR